MMTKKQFTIKSRIKYLFLALSLSGAIGITASCTKEDVEQIIDILSEAAVQSLASWIAGNEDIPSIPQDIVIHDNSGNLPSSIDLSSKFPPIGNQGNYGTCVAWATAYNLKTVLNGIDNQWTSTQLSKTENQTSPADLFLAIPTSEKGYNCNGTQFEAAMEVLISRGGASLATAPYTNIGDCSQTPPSSWNQDAADNKLVNYRKIADKSNTASMTVENFKGYLAEGRPIVIGAQLGDRFMRWNSDAILDYDTYLNPGMQHAYHALILAGYDDSRQAFKIINSWGETWGSNGTIWVDYTFFLNSFCYAAFVAQNKTEVEIQNNQIGNVASGTDLLSWNLTDSPNAQSTNALDREIVYDVYNSGTSLIKSADRWSILYMYYNAYDANDYGILIHDYYTDEFSTTPGANDFWPDGYGIAGSWWNYIDVPSGKSVAEALYGNTGSQFSFTYQMPSNLTGKYYLVLIADGFNDIEEVNEDNNYFFYSNSDGSPLELTNGIISPKSSLKIANPNRPMAFYQNSAYQTLVKPGRMNTYSPKEIMNLIKSRKESGDLQSKVNKFHLKDSGMGQKRRAH
jgi:C1A family cysteine protease